MDTVQALRCFLQLAACAMFFYQTTIACSKFFSNKTIVSTRTVNYEFLPNLSYVLCARHQYRHAVAKEHGYQDLFDFEMGKVKDQNQRPGNVTLLRWGGKTNLTAKKMIDKMYVADYSGLSRRNPKLKMSDIFIPFIGKCKKLSGLNHEDSVSMLNFPLEGANNAYEVFILDPNLSTTCGIDKSSFSGDPIQYTPNKTGLAFYTISLELVEYNTVTGLCKHYGESGMEIYEL